MKSFLFFVLLLLVITNVSLAWFSMWSNNPFCGIASGFGLGAAVTPLLSQLLRATLRAGDRTYQSQTKAQ